MGGRVVVVVVRRARKLSVWSCGMWLASAALHAKQCRGQLPPGAHTKTSVPHDGRGHLRESS